jgi:hypothetical protein
VIFPLTDIVNIILAVLLVSLFRITKTVLNIILTYFTKTNFFIKSVLKMISKNNKINCYTLKSKIVFETFFKTLSKLAKQIKIHIKHKFKSIILKGKTFLQLFYKLLCYQSGIQKYAVWHFCNKSNYDSNI